MILWYGMICTGLGILISMVRANARQASPRSAALNPQETLHDPLVPHDLHWSRNSDIHGEDLRSSGISQHSILFVTDPQL